MNKICMSSVWKVSYLVDAGTLFELILAETVQEAIVLFMEYSLEKYEVANPTVTAVSLKYQDVLLIGGAE